MMWTLWLACQAPIETPGTSPTGLVPDPIPDPAPEGLVVLDVAPRNVLMISIDTLRRDHVDRYATDGVVRAPVLSDWLAQGVTLDDHIQCSNWTFASTNCTLSGLYLEEGVFMPRMGPDGSPIPGGQPTLARHLGTYGFVSHLETTNTYLSDDVGNAQGYSSSNRENGATAEVVDRGLANLGALLPTEDAPPWLLHLHLYEPHGPYTPPDEYLAEADALPPTIYAMGTSLGQTLALRNYQSHTEAEQVEIRDQLYARYTADIRWLDDQLDAAFARLDAEGWLDDTLVVVWTDHGEQFWEHNGQGHAKALTYGENDAVLSFWAKGLTPASHPGPTHAVDTVPTILHALDLPVPASLSGYPVGLAPADRPRFVATSAFWGQFQSVVLDGWKLEMGWSGTMRLWNRNADPQEAEDLYHPTHQRAEDLWELLEPRVELLEPLIPEATVIWP